MQKLWQSKKELLIQNLPPILKTFNYFCLTKDKKPYDIWGNLIKPNNKNDFTSFQNCLSHLNNGFETLGIGLFDNLCGIDIDHCVDDEGRLNDTARAVLNLYPDMYAEYSPSKKGIHLIGYSNYHIDKNKYYFKHNSLEVYSGLDTVRYFRITGDKIQGGDLVECDLRLILDKFMLRSINTPLNENQGLKPNFKGNWLINDVKLNQLFNDTQHNQGDESEHDLALCSKLAFYTGCESNLIDNYFRQSPWYNSKDEYHLRKWEREDYRSHTINMACSNIQYNTITPIHYDEVVEVKAVNITNKYSLDDTGNSHRFYDEYGLNIKYNLDNKEFMIFNGNTWQEDISHSIRLKLDEMADNMEKESENYYHQIMNKENNEKDIKRYKEMLKNISYLRSKKGKDNCLNELQYLPNIPCLNNEFDIQPYLLSTKSGIYDLRTGKIIENTKELKITKNTGFEVNFKEPKLFLKFLKDITCNHPDIFNYLHSILGYVITGETREQLMWILQGDGNDGKSLLLNIISNVLGDYSIKADKSLIMDSVKNDNTQNNIAMLKGARLAIIDELASNVVMKEDLVKEMTSSTGSKMIGKFLYKNPFSFTFMAKILISTNYSPRIKGIDKGIWRRLVILPFDRNLKDDEVDKSLFDKIIKEAPSILGWLIQGAIDYYKNGLPELPISIQVKTTDFKKDNDIIQRWLEENCDLNDPDAYESSAILYDNYCKWCERGNEKPYTLTAFGKNIIKKLPRKGRLGNGVVYFGVSLNKKIVIDVAKIEKAKAMAEVIDDDKDI